MKVIAYRRYGPPGVVAVEDAPDPAPGPGEVLVRVHASAVTSGDARLRAFRIPPLFRLPARAMLGWTAPRRRVLGGAFSGVVEATGPGADRYAPGDAVAGFHLFDVHAELKCAPEAQLIPLPAGLSHEQAASLPFGACTALHFLGAAGVEAGSRVAVVGAAGAVGLAAVQVARARGAVVTAICSGDAADLVRGLGADAVIDRRAEDFSAGGPRWDVLVDAVGGATPAQARRCLAPGGVHVCVVMGGAALGAAMRGALRLGPRTVIGTSTETPERLAETFAMNAAGALRPVIDGIYPFEEAAAAHARVDSGRKRGEVILRHPAAVA
ncbi:MAG: NAD(P)-dependent alcohol dehydrogenase [Pseudomonadota bacterium]|nr:NAD(P)-dependent alcohol dehydrogenase [Pseudomonadota bacterium]MEE3098631.1 NAD(P)-dependent alcohol dehydrogenase [Pseudomonadota bacterium]